MTMIKIGPCYRCKCEMSIPEDLYRAAKHSEHISFYCAYGHDQIFKQGETDEQKLRRERDMLKQRLACKDDEIEYQRKQTISLEGQVTKLKRRAKNGICPCCTRSFTNLKRHMDTQHPGFKTETNVVPFEQSA